jgi:hypothetical protein
MLALCASTPSPTQKLGARFLVGPDLLERRDLRCHTHRTLKGETERPRIFSSFETRTWPQAGCSSANSTTACSIFGTTRFFRIGFWRLISCKGQLTAPLVQLLEAIEAIPAVSHDLAALADIAELFGEFR